MDIYRLSAQLTVINRDRIFSMGDLESRIKKLSEDYSAMQEQLAHKLLDQERVQELIEQCEYYFTNVDKDNLSAESSNRLEIIKNIMKENNISNKHDLLILQSRNSDMLKNIADRRNMLSQKKNKLVRYVDIRDTHNIISRGDFISNLIEEQKARREQEKQMENRKSVKRKGRR